MPYYEFEINEVSSYVWNALVEADDSDEAEYKMSDNDTVWVGEKMWRDTTHHDHLLILEHDKIPARYDADIKAGRDNAHEYTFSTVQEWLTFKARHQWDADQMREFILNMVIANAIEPTTIEDVYAVELEEDGFYGTPEGEDDEW